MFLILVGKSRNCAEACASYAAQAGQKIDNASAEKSRLRAGTNYR